MYYKLKNTTYCLLLLALFSFKHPYYLSVCELKYQSNNKELNGSIKIFINDLETALSKTQPTKVDLIHPVNKTASSALLCEYLKKHLAIRINDSEISYNCLGFETEEDVVWIYIEANNCPVPKKVSIENSILFEDFKSQSNIVHVEINGIKKSSKVNNPDKVLQFDFTDTY